MSFPRCETQAISHVSDSYRGDSVVDDKTFKDLLDGTGIGSLSSEKWSKSTELDASLEELQFQEMLSIFGSVPANIPPSTFDGGLGPCLICSGPHTRAVCALKYRCPLDQKVGEKCKVICRCGSDVVEGKCVKEGCSYNYGCAVNKKQWFEWFE